jgi:hypothetical protein
MSISTPVPATIEIRRSRLLGLVVAVAAVAAAITWAVLALTVNTEAQVVKQSPATPDQAASFEQFAKSISLLARAQQTAAARYAGTLSPNDKRYIAGRTPRSIMDLTPGDLASGLWGYGVPSNVSDPNLTDVLSSMNPASKRYVTSLMRLTFRQLAAGAAGSP